MRRITLAGFLCVLILASFLYFEGIRPVKAYDTIYIRADGSVDPPTAPIHWDGYGYYLTDNIIFGNLTGDGIIVERGGIFLEGDGYKIQGTGVGMGGIGICVSGVNGVPIIRLKIEGFSIGVLLNDSDQNAIERCSFSGNLFSIKANNSDFNSIGRNNIMDSGLGTHDESAAISLFSSDNNTIWLNNMTSGSDWGILENSSSNNTHFWNNIKGFNTAGICLRSNCINNTIEENNVACNTVCGIRLVSSSFNSIFNNNISENQEGIVLDNSLPTSIFANRITNNDIGITVYNCSQVLGIGFHPYNVSIYQNNMTDNGVGINFTSSTGCNIIGNNITNSHVGIGLQASSQNDISDNDISATECSVSLTNSVNNTISGNNIAGSNASAGMGIESFSDSNTITGNSILNNNVGIDVYLSKNCSIFKNDLINNNNALVLSSSNNNKLRENMASGSSILGLSLNDSHNNSFSHNSLTNNTHQVQLHNSTNTWDDGSPLGGNYWSDYTADNNEDGLGDAPYIIDENNTDHHPLMGFYHSYDVYQHSYGFQPVIVISNSTIDEVELWFADSVHSPTGLVWFLHLTGVTGQEGTTGFCRVTFPNIMMNSSSYPVYIGSILEETQPTSSRIVGSNGTHTTLYFAYVHPVPHSAIDVLPEFPSFLVLPLLFMATLLIIVLRRKKLVRAV